jgi:hypothetical protein
MCYYIVVVNERPESLIPPGISDYFGFTIRGCRETHEQVLVHLEAMREWYSVRQINLKESFILAARDRADVRAQIAAKYRIDLSTDSI